MFLSVHDGASQCHSCPQGTCTEFNKCFYRHLLDVYQPEHQSCNTVREMLICELHGWHHQHHNRARTSILKVEEDVLETPCTCLLLLLLLRKPPLSSPWRPLLAAGNGLAEAHHLDILDFAFCKLARDYKLVMKDSDEVKELNNDMIHYLYHGQPGIDMTCHHLQRGDAWLQIVAAMVVRFWVVEEERIESQGALFRALQGVMCGAGKAAELALNSIECSGRAWAENEKGVMAYKKPYPFLINADFRAPGTNAVDALIGLLLEANHSLCSSK